MKKILYIMCALLIGVLASCSNSDQEALDSSASDLQPVRISVQTEQSTSTTRATTSPEGITRFAIEVYADAAYTVAANVFEDGSTNKEGNATGVFNMILDKTKSYYCLFWADNGESYTITNLQSITLATDKATTESFYGTSVITTAAREQSVTLKHAVSKIALTETKSLPIGTLAVKFDDRPGFNVATAKAQGTAKERIVTMNIEAAVAAGASFGDAIYTFAEAEQKTLQDVEFTFQIAGLSAEPAFKVTNVPLQTNFTTNIKGHFISKSAFSFDVTCDETWSNPDNDVTFPEPAPTIIGYFSGEWIEVDNNDNPSPGSGIWRMAKQVVVANADVNIASMAWATGNESLGISRTDGKTNTLNQYKQNGTYQYPASTACFKLNNGYSIIVKADDTNYKWYLPALSQLTGVALSNVAFVKNDGFTPFLQKNYWTSTEETGDYAYCVDFVKGITDKSQKTISNAMMVRCVGDL